MKLPVSLSAIFLSLSFLRAQDSAHREIIYGIGPGVAYAVTNQQPLIDYFYSDTVLGPRIAGSEPSILDRSRPELQCSFFTTFNRNMEVAFDLSAMRRTSANVNGNFQLYYMRSELNGKIYAGKNKEFRPYISAGIGYARTQAVITDYEKTPHVLFGNAQITDGETRNFYLDGASFTTAIGINLINTIQRKNDGSAWKANALMISLQAGVNYCVTNEWKSPNGTTATGAVTIDPFEYFVGLQVSFGMVTEYAVENRGD